MIGAGPQPVPAQAVPSLPRGVRLKWCAVRGSWYLLAPERAVKLNPIAAAVLQTVDGTRTVNAIVDHLAESYAAPRERIAADVSALLTDFAARMMVTVRA